MEAQEKLKKQSHEKVELPKDYLKEFKSYDIVFTGRKSTLLYNEKTGEIIIDGQIYKPQVIDCGSHYEIKVLGKHSYNVSYSEGHIFLDGRMVDFSFTPSVPKLKRKGKHGANKIEIRSPLPGVIVGLHVKEGDIVKQGDKIATLEAMKMQNELVTDQDGIVEKIHIKINDQTETNQIIALINTKIESN